MESRPYKDLFTARNTGILLGLLFVIKFAAVLLGKETFFYRDFGVLAYPTIAYFRDCFWRGEFPLWNPYSNCGVPFMAQWGTMTLYPLNLIYLLLPIPWSVNVFCLAHVWLGGMGMYYLAKRWCGSAPGGMLAAVIYSFNGIILSTLTWPNYTAAAGLAPWVILVFERCWEEPAKSRPWRNVAVAAVLGAVQLLTGVPEISALTFFIVTGLWIWRVISRKQSRAANILHFFAACLIMTGLTAVQLFPFLELLSHSQRAPGVLPEKWALPPWGWANFILPAFHAFETPQGTLWQYGQQFLSSTYLGFAPLCLGITGLVLAWKNPLPRWLGFFFLFGAIMALGSAGIIYPILKDLFPGLSIARFPVKFLFLCAFSLPLLAAIGLKGLLEPYGEKQGNRWIVLSCAFLCVLVAGLLWFARSYPFQYDYWPTTRNNSLVRLGFGVAILFSFYFALLNSCIRRTYALLAGCLLLGLDGLYNLPRQNPTTDSSVFVTNLWEAAHQVAKPSAGHGRVFISPEAEQQLLRSKIREAEKDLAGKRLAAWSHLNLLERIPKVNGSATLQVREQAALQNWLYAETNSSVASWLDFLNATLETSSNSVVEWQPRGTALPFVDAGKAVAGLALSSNNWLAATEVRSNLYLENPPPSFAPLPATKASVTNLIVSAHEIRFSVTAAVETFASIAQSWYPGWKAEVNGTPVEILKANHAFQAVRIPKGTSTVRIYYSDRWFHTGLVVTVATMALVGIALLLEKKKRSSHV